VGGQNQRACSDGGSEGEGRSESGSQQEVRSEAEEAWHKGFPYNALSKVKLFLKILVPLIKVTSGICCCCVQRSKLSMQF